MEINLNRKSGILLHPTALPGPFGIGEIGYDAYSFIDDLSEMGQRIWQVLPIGPADFYNSPYSSSSTFAGNHLLISLELLEQDDLLDTKDLDKYRIPNLSRVDFNKVIRTKMPILKKVSRDFKLRASEKMINSFKSFCDKESYWLDDYARYWALKDENNQSCWIDWKSFNPRKIESEFEAKVMQFIFHDQWSRLREYAREKGVKIVGDMPIYVGYDSADVCFNRNLFQLDMEGKMEYQGGCPPCNYQQEGQLWGTPLYNWDIHINSNFEWWRKRFRKLFEMVDSVRLDHFIGYARYYRIPLADKTSHNGEWIKSPGDQLFAAVKEEIEDFNVIAEDLGEITQEVLSLRDRCDFPGMRVLQFEPFENFSQSNFPKNSVLFTGTHDNDTLIGWLNSLGDEEMNQSSLTKKKLINLFGCSENDIHWEMIRYIYQSESNTVITPIQDILGEDSLARFNTPGTLSSDNWSWRLGDEKLTQFIKQKMSKLVEYYNRK